MTNDAWNPNQYEKFKKERAQPFFDLMDLLQAQNGPRIVDLGCGTGELTAELHKKMKASETIGSDSSDEMLKKAQAFQTSSLHFLKQKIEEFRDSKGFDIIFSNAAIQWCSNHSEIFRNLKAHLRESGQLAIQMPMNHDYPTHVIAYQLSQEEPWASLLKGFVGKSDMLTAEEYASLLFKLGFKEQKVSLRVYGHVLDSRDGVIEWVKGTLLTQFQSRLSADDFGRFVAEFRRRLFAQLPDERPFFYPFKRILIWAKN